MPQVGDCMSPMSVSSSITSSFAREELEQALDQALDDVAAPHVVLRGLQSADLNGVTGRALGTDCLSGRIKVELDDGRPAVNIKPKNVIYGDAGVVTCAECHKAEKDTTGVVLKKFGRCSHCKLAAYCSVKCQKEHRRTHMRECICVSSP